MILIIGPAHSGKKEYAKTLGYEDSDMSFDAFCDKKVIFDVEKLIFEDPSISSELLPVLLEKEVVICCEVGSGIIPASKHERISREAVGRLCIALAQNAEKVVRIQCGIPTVIKG